MLFQDCCSKTVLITKVLLKLLHACGPEPDNKGLVINCEERVATNWEVGQVKFYPYKKGEGVGTSFSHAEGGGATRFKVVSTWELEVLAMRNRYRGHNKFPSFKKGGAQRV